MQDAFTRIEADVVAIGEFLERARRYRPLAATAAVAYRRATEIAARVRRVNRAHGETTDLESLAAEIHGVHEGAERDLEEFLEGTAYRGLVEALAGEATDAGERIAEVFADIEPIEAHADLHLPIAARTRRGAATDPTKRSALEGSPGVLEPEAVAQVIARALRDGVEPESGPGVGADRTIRPIRFFEGTDGIDAAIFLIVASGTPIPAPTFRAPELGEVLVYARRLVVPFTVGLRERSPDDWLELRAGGYPDYRRRCRELLEAAGCAVVDVTD